MKANINKNGVLTIFPETEIEEYSLSMWSKFNITPHVGTLRTDNFIIKTRMEDKNVCVDF